MFVDVGQGKEYGHGVDILGRAALGNPSCEPFLDDIQELLVACEFVVFPKAVQSNPVCPFPAMPGFCIDYTGVREAEEELARVVVDVG